jgi:hypothetical protein
MKRRLGGRNGRLDDDFERDIMGTVVWRWEIDGTDCSSDETVGADFGGVGP